MLKARPVIVNKNNNKMATWTRKPQEQDGNYFFFGQFLATRSVVEELPTNEIISICHDIKTFVHQKNGVDYLQVYTDEQGRKLYLINQLSKEMIESG